MKVAESVAADPRDRGGAAGTARRTGEAQMAAWEAGRRRRPAGVDVVRRSRTRGDNGQRYLPQKDGSILAPGLRPDEVHTHVKARPSPLKTVTAFRLELLNDPNLPCDGPGRSFKGTCALTEFEVEAADEQDRAKTGEGEVRQGDRRLRQPRARRWSRTSTTRRTSKRVTGPVEFAIDGKDETAWGIDAGPGRRNVPRKAVFVPEKPVELAGGDRAARST